LFLITGATGKTGRGTIENLRQRGLRVHYQPIPVAEFTTAMLAKGLRCPPGMMQVPRHRCRRSCPCRR
jgi:hypothetical protein